MKMMKGLNGVASDKGLEWDGPNIRTYTVAGEVYYRGSK